jgi:1,4-alpha-glucan branching enzyme
MLFMGEEWAADQPFPFFCDFGPDLAAAVRNGRREEFSRFPEFQDPAQRERIPDPIAEATFQSAKLDWGALDRDGHAEWLALYRRLLGIRREEIVPRLRGKVRAGRSEVLGPGAVRTDWTLAEASRLTLVANLSSEPLDAVMILEGRQLWCEGAVGSTRLGPWTVIWTLESPDSRLGMIKPSR